MSMKTNISRPEQSVENDNEQFFRKKMNDLVKNRIVICTMNQYKHGGWEATVGKQKTIQHQCTFSHEW